MTTIQLAIEGMTCQHCVQSVVTALSGVAHVRSAAVDFETHSASVQTDGDAVMGELLHAVVEAGYAATLV